MFVFRLSQTEWWGDVGDSVDFQCFSLAVSCCYCWWCVWIARSIKLVCIALERVVDQRRIETGNFWLGGHSTRAIGLFIACQISRVLRIIDGFFKNGEKRMGLRFNWFKMNVERPRRRLLSLSSEIKVWPIHLIDQCIYLAAEMSFFAQFDYNRPPHWPILWYHMPFTVQNDIQTTQPKPNVQSLSQDLHNYLKVFNMTDRPKRKIFSLSSYLWIFKIITIKTV